MSPPSIGILEYGEQHCSRLGNRKRQQFCVVLSFREGMLGIDVETDEAIDSVFLSACDNMGLLISRKRLRDHVVAAGLQSNLRVGSILIDTYYKERSIELATG
jgi:hypothetical protein